MTIFPSENALSEVVIERPVINRYIRKADHAAQLLTSHIEELDEEETVRQESLLATLSEAKSTLEVISSYLQGLKAGSRLS